MVLLGTVSGREPMRMFSEPQGKGYIRKLRNDFFPLGTRSNNRSRFFSGLCGMPSMLETCPSSTCFRAQHTLEALGRLRASSQGHLLVQRLTACRRIRNENQVVSGFNWWSIPNWVSHALGEGGGGRNCGGDSYN